MTMTFNEFIRTRRVSDDLARDLPDSAGYFEKADGETRSAAGHTYVRTCFIEQNSDGSHTLTTHDDAHTTRDLGQLEMELYDWLVSEGWI